MIISEKQIMKMINICHEYRAWLLEKGANEAAQCLSTFLISLQDQQSEELKEIE